VPIGLLVVASLLAAGSPPAMISDARAADSTVSDGRLRTGGRLRTYRLVVPHDTRDRARPLVVLLHGGGTRENGRRMALDTGFDAVARRSGAMAVYPDAVRGRFDAGRCCSATPVDDVAFVDALVRRIRRRHRIDPRRISAVGFSNGGFLAYRLACERARTFSSVAVVATTDLHGGCRPARRSRCSTCMRATTRACRSTAAGFSARPRSRRCSGTGGRTTAAAAPR
jgi:poly(3-hydroxybutyrate) depolymerase